MALYVYNKDSGALYSWCPTDTDPVADDATLAQNGLAVVFGLPELGYGYVWDENARTVILANSEGN